MFTKVPEELLNKENEEVLEYIQDLSAHDGVAEELVKSVKPLGDVQVYCPEWESFRYVVVSTGNIIFGVALGQDIIAYRLNDEFKEKALLTGCKLYPQLGESWVWVNPYSGDWPRVDFTFWARKSYVSTRETALA